MIRGDKRDVTMFSQFILLWGVVRLCDCVTYQLSAVPEMVGLGQSLTITANLLSPTKAGTELKIMLSKPSLTDPLTVFMNLPSCTFGLLPADNEDREVYSRTGTIVQCDPTNSRYIIRFHHLEAEHFGTYYIEAHEEDLPVSSQAGIQAEVKSSVVITPPILEVIEGQGASLKCTVDNGTPLPVSFTWRIYSWDRNIVQLSSQIQHESADRSYTLTWTSVSRSDRASYQCTASDTQGSRMPSEWVVVTVYYETDNVAMNVDGTNVNVGETVTFTCTATGGYPNPGLVIYDTASDASMKEVPESWDGSPRTLTLQRLMQKSDNGATYRCRTKTSVFVGGSTIPVKESNSVTFTVKFPPISLKVPDTVTVDEGQSESVRCETSSSSDPRTLLTWSGSGSDQTSASTSPGQNAGVETALDLTITGNRSRNGNLITCTAAYLGKSIFTQSTELNVNFAPQGITFYDTPDTPIIENQERVMRCRAETSNPAGTIVWRKLLNGVESVVRAGADISQVPGDYGGIVLEAAITIKPTRQDGGSKYWSEVEFTYTNGTKVSKKSSRVSLVVYYSVNVRIDIIESDPVILTCVTTGGNPPTIEQYSWSRDKEVVIGASERSLLVQHEQGGNYSCSATNKGGVSSSPQVNVAVKYKPILDPTVEHQLQLSAAFGDNVTFSVSVLANPQPSAVVWSKIRSTLPLGPRFRADSRDHVYSLRVSNIRPEDFTTYACKVMNSVGATTFFVTLKTKRPPDTPRDFAVVARTKATLTLGWKSQFPGAANQVFLLELLGADPRVFVVVDPGVGLEVTQTVSDLKPDTDYRFRLRAKNDLGLFSPYTDTLSARTETDLTTDLQVRIDQSDETTVVIEWFGRDDLFSKYPDAMVEVQYVLADQAVRQLFSGLKNSTTARFADRNTRISVLKGFAYTFNVIIHDGETVIFQRFNLSTETVHDEESKQSNHNIIWILVGVSAVIVIVASVSAVVAALCLYVRRKRRASKAPETTQANAAANAQTPNNTQAFQNPAFGEDVTSTDPGNSQYFVYRDHKYAVVGLPEDSEAEYSPIQAEVHPTPVDENGYLAPNIRGELPRPPSLSESDVIELRRGDIRRMNALPKPPPISRSDFTEFLQFDIPTTVPDANTGRDTQI